MLGDRRCSSRRAPEFGSEARYRGPFRHWSLPNLSFISPPAIRAERALFGAFPYLLGRRMRGQRERQHRPLIGHQIRTS